MTLFPELREHLAEGLELAAPGQTFVITRYRSAESNLRTTFTKIPAGAGLVAWPRLFHNQRASRQTGLTNGFPLHGAAEWMGNTPKVVLAHYLSVTPEHVSQANCRAEGGTRGGTHTRGNGPESDRNG